MVNVNKKYIDKKLRLEAWNRFLKEIKKSESVEDFILNLGEFFTQSEMTMLEKRLSIPILAEKKLSYRAIGETLDVSPVTISFVKHNLNKLPAVHKKYSFNKKTRKTKALLPPYKGMESII